MPVSAATLRRLAALELSAEAMAGVLEIIADMQEHDERRKEAQRNRKQRSRDGRVTVTHLSRGQSQQKNVPPHPPIENTSEAKASGAVAPPDERARLFRWGLETVSRMTGRPPETVRKLLGRWLKALNDDCRGLNRIFEDAVAANPAEPVSWIEGVIRSRGTGPPRASPQGGFAAIALELGNHDDQRRFDQPEPAYCSPPADPPGVVALARYPAQRR